MLNAHQLNRPRPPVCSVLDALFAVLSAQSRWWRAVEPLWVTGLALLCLLLGHVLFRGAALNLQGKSYDYAQYLLAGTLFPLALFGAPLLWRRRGFPAAGLRAAQRALAIGTLFWSALYVVVSVVRHGPALMLVPLLLAVVQTVLMTRPWRRQGTAPERLALTAVVAVTAWTAVMAAGLEIFVRPPAFFAGLLAALALACGATWHAPGISGLRPRGQLGAWATALSLTFIALMSLRTEGLFDVLGDRGAIHHWSVWVGAAELVRQGGWLLWDVPSMYGFLSILPLAVLTSETPWQALYLGQALAQFIVAAGLFLTLRMLRPGRLNGFLALIVAVTVSMYFASFEVSGPVLISTFVLPNHGAYRNFWPFVLLLLLTWACIATDTRRQRWLMAGGCLAWVLGVLWSAESAFFCSGIWLPAYALMVLEQASKGPNPRRGTVLHLILPFALLAAAVGLVSAVYLAGLGRMPDWLGYVDFVFAFGTTAQVVVNDPTGPVLGILLGLGVFATAAWYGGMRRGTPKGWLALFVGLCGAFWTTSLYGYVRAYPDLHPVTYAALAIVMAVVVHRFPASGWRTAVSAAAVPLIALFLVSPVAAIVASPLAVREASSSLAATVRLGLAVEPRMPDADPGLQQLLAEAGIGAGDPLSFQGSWIGNLMWPWKPGTDPGGERIVTTRDWLPGHPYVMLRYMPAWRGPVYMGRFVDRVQRGGWLVQHKTGETAKPSDQHEFVSGREPWFFPTLGQTHVPTRVFENEEWQLVWFDYVGRDSNAARPEYTEFRGLAPLPADVSVDGVPLTGQKDPAIWVLPGTGWGWYEPDIRARWVERESELWVYSRSQRPVAFELQVLPGDQPEPTLEVTGEENRSPAEGRAGKRLGRDGATLVLGPGWNRVKLRLDAAAPADGWYVTQLDIRTT